MTSSALPDTFEQLMAAGSNALRAGDWDLALRCFQSAAQLIETAESLEGVATAAWWADQAGTMFEARQRAYRLYRQREDFSGAARMATWLGLDHYIFRHAPAIANGWIQRAQRLLEPLDEPTFEHAFLEFARGHIALENHQISRALEHARNGRGFSRQLEIYDLEVTCMALEGLTLVSQGAVARGMDLLDEAVASAMSGDVGDPDAKVTACCYFFYACERVRDFPRAAQWCDVITELCQRWSYRSMVSVCRAHYASILTWTGEWDRAERELQQSCEELLNGRAGWAPEAILRLAELRRRQGRLDEAEEFLEQSAGNPLALICRAQIAMERGDVTLARELIERFFRRIPATEHTQHLNALEVAVRIYAHIGHDEDAWNAARQLELMAEAAGTKPLQGASCFSLGTLLHARGELNDARRAYEDAIDLYVESGAKHDTAQVRVELAGLLGMMGRTELAIAECSLAVRAFQELGAQTDQERAGKLLRELGPEVCQDPARSAAAGLSNLIDLTPREREILAKIAEGLANPDIAEQFFISVRTVERHVSTIYRKIGAHGSAARAYAVALALDNDNADTSSTES